MTTDQHSGPNAEHNTDPIRVAFIVGAGRSGSTVMDIVLGNHPDVASVGELCNLHRSGWTNNEYCACGDRGQQCNFWSDVFREWTAQSSAAEVSRYLDLQEKFENFRHFGRSRWLRLGRERIWQSQEFQDFTAQTGQLYKAIAAVSGKRIIVDSSKNPLRAAILSRVPEVDLRLIHLVRDGRAVAWSRQKAFEKDEKGGVASGIRSRPIWYSVTWWTIVNMISGLVRRTQSDKSLLVRYEDFVADPRTSLDQIGDLVGVDLGSVTQGLLDGDAMQVSHAIAGNRVRMTGSVKLKADLEWQRMLPTRERRICWAIAGWMLYSYQYERGVEHPTLTAPQHAYPQPIGSLMPYGNLLEEPRVSAV